MKKILTLTAGLLLAVTVSAQSKKEDCIIMTDSGRTIHAASVEVAKNAFRYMDGKIGKSIPKKDVQWVWIPKPKEVRAADKLAREGKHNDAAAAYRKAAKEFEELGWEVYCTYKQADCLKESGDSEGAIAALEKLIDYKPVMPKNEDDLLSAYKMLIKEYVAAKTFDKAIPIVDSLTISKNDDVACGAFITKGEVLEAKYGASKNREDLKSAALAYFQAALLFPKSKERPEALLRAYNAMKMANDARAEKFAEILKKEHAGSAEAKQLK